MDIQLGFKRIFGKGKPKSSGSEFLERLLGNKCFLSDAEENTSGLLNRRSISDLILLRTPLVLCYTHKIHFSGR